MDQIGTPEINKIARLIEKNGEFLEVQKNFF